MCSFEYLIFHVGKNTLCSDTRSILFCINLYHICNNIEQFITNLFHYIKNVIKTKIKYNTTIKVFNIISSKIIINNIK